MEYKNYFFECKRFSMKNLTSLSKFLYFKQWETKFNFTYKNMKKLKLFGIWFLAIFMLNFQFSNAISLSSFTPAIDKKVANMKTTQEKVNFLKKFSTLLGEPAFTKDKNARLFEDIRDYTLNMLKVFESELEQENIKKWSKTTTSKATSNTSNKSSSTTNTTSKTSKTTVSKLPDLSDTFTNIDINRVREAVLSRHNNERDNVWANDYKYNINLEKAALVRATKLNNEWKTSNMHLRKSGDGYYNYNSILERFSNLGIEFPASIGSAASFSESVWYGYYKCNSSDCTDALINAIKKTRTWLILKEKSYNWSHYRAAVMKHFTQMGIWISIDYSLNRYYLVLEYWVDYN